MLKQAKTNRFQGKNRELSYKDVRVGDAFYIPANASSGSREGNVTKVMRVNLEYKVDVRFRPEGPWYHQTHVVPRTTLRGGRVLRDGQLYDVV